MNLLKKYNYRILDIATILCFMTLSIDYVVGKRFVQLLVLIYVLYYYKEIINIKLKNTKSKFLVLLIVLLFLLHALTLFYSDNIRRGLFIIEKTWTLFAIPILFLLKSSNINRLNYGFKGFIIGVFSTALYNLLRALYRSINYENSQFIFDARVLKHKGFSFMESVVQGGNYFFYSEFSSFLNPNYYAFYILIAILILFKEKLWNIRWRLSLILFFLGLIFLLSSRACYLALFIIIIYEVYNKLKSTKISFYYKSGIIFSLLFVSILLFKNNPRTAIVFKKLSTLNFNFNKKGQYSHDTRLMAWDAALELIKVNFWFGVGIGDAQDELVKKYMVKEYKVPLKHNYDVHNQFLETFVAMGIIGFLCLVMIFCLPFLPYFNESIHPLMIPFLIVMGISFLFEGVLTTYAGIVFFSLFYPLLAIKK